MDTKDFDKLAKTWDKDPFHARAHEIYKILRQKITLSASDSVLDFGSGTGLLGFNFAKEAGSLSFADTSAEMLKQAQRKAQDLGITVSTLNLSQSALSGSYNVVTSLLALHHTTDLRKALANLASCVAAGGYLCLSDLDPEDGSFHAPDVVPYNGIDRSVVLEVLQEQGLNVTFNDVIYVEKRPTREYPIFLIVAQKNH